MAEEILPTAFFSEYKEEPVQEKIIKDQLSRIEKLLQEAQVLEINKEIKDKVIQNGIARKAPMHKKSSIADAIIVYSLINFAEKNPGNHFFFVSNDKTDFYEKGNHKKVIHSDLKNDFRSNNIQEFTTLKKLIWHLKRTHGLK